jgi:hypothetical protein
MAVTEAERVQIRRYVGYPMDRLYVKLEAAICRIQASTEPGSYTVGGQTFLNAGLYATNDVEVFVRGLLTNLATVEARLGALWDSHDAGKVDELTVDGPRGALMLRSEGRRLVGQLAGALGVPIYRDVFSTPKVDGIIITDTI